MFWSVKPRQQGDLGELSAIDWLSAQGYRVWIPLGHSPDVDLIATRGEQTLRVEVKTCTRSRAGGRWDVMICTRGGNQSWNGIVKRFDPARCDYLFVLVGDGRRWFIPTRAITSSSGLALGCPKYSEFEVEQGRPILRAVGS